jgi:hypothetical protein
MLKFLIPAIGAGLGACHGAWRFAYWLGHTRPSVFGIHNAYSSVGIGAGLGAVAGVAIVGLLQRHHQRRQDSKLAAWLLAQSGREDLLDHDRAVIAALYQDLLHHQRKTKASTW